MTDELPVLLFSAIFARSSAMVISLSPLSSVVRGNAVCQSIDNTSCENGPPL